MQAKSEPCFQYDRVACPGHDRSGTISTIPTSRPSIHTFDEMMLLAWTIMLYKALATVLNLTVPAFRLVIATKIACTYG